MNLNLLKTFCTFLESENMLEAARRMNLTQPAISQQLKMLEDELGEQLFIIKGKKKVATATGERLYRDFKPKIQQLVEKWREVKKGRSPQDIEIRFGGRKDFIESLVEKIQFEGKLFYQFMGSDEAYRKLLARELDVVVTSFKPTHQRLIFKKITTIKSRWFYDSPIKHAHLMDERIYKIPLIAFSKTTNFYQEWCAHYKLDYERLNIKAMIDSWAMVKGLCLQYKAASIVPENIPVHLELDKEFVPVSIVKPVDFYLVYHEDFKDHLKFGKFSL